jgi:hypothetical protein
MTKIKIILLLFLLLTFNKVYLCQDNDDYSYYGSNPINLLPTSIHVLANKAYLWIDSNSIQKNNIDVYIINNTNKILELDGYQLAGIQQEYKTNSNNWHRIKIFHYGWCGTPYLYGKTIKPKEFYKSVELFRSGDKKSEVRYKVYGSQVEISNSIIGSIDTTETEAAQYDDIAYEYCDADYLIKVIKEMPKPYKTLPGYYENNPTTHRNPTSILEDLNGYIVENAMMTLSNRFPTIALKVFESIRNNKNHPHFEYALKLIERIKNKITR